MSSLISVIMPVFNAEKFVAEAVGSVLRQTYPDWELLIVNDGSTDGSVDIVESFTDARIRLFTQPNKGVSAARNRALLEMKGDFFCFLDADDELTVNSLQARIDLLLANENIHFADGMVKIYDETLKHEVRTWIPDFKGAPLQCLAYLSGRCFFGPTWMVRVMPGRKYAMDESLTHGEDLLFYIAVAEQGLYTFTPACILHYRKHNKSAMSNLKGLATGYTMLREKIVTTVGDKLSFSGRLTLQLKTRKIMFFSFLKARKWIPALQYLIFGSI